MKFLLAASFALLASLSLASLSLAGGGTQSATDYAALRAQAEQHYARGSYTLARRVYQRAEGLELDESQSRWVEFRLADTHWRALATSRNQDPSEMEAAHEELEKVLEHWKRAEQHDSTWAQAQASMGDYHWARDNSSNWGLAWGFYRQAFDYWANSTDLEPARAHYLGLYERLVSQNEGRDWKPRQALSQLPESILRGAVRLARGPLEVGRMNYWLAHRLSQQSLDPRVHERTREAFLAAIAAGADPAFHADPLYPGALYEYGNWLEEHGVLHSDAERGVWSEPDFAGALESYRRLLAEFESGEARHWSGARSRVKRILAEEVALSVGRFFLPGSEVEFQLRWRNVDTVRFSLYRLDLTRDVRLLDKRDSQGSWLDTLEPGALELEQRWSFSTGDDGGHAWGHEDLELAKKISPGAYLLEATGGAARSRELVLMSDAGLVVKTWGDDVLCWFAGVETGEPIAEAEVRVFHRNKNNEAWSSSRATTDVDGIARFDLSDGRSERHSYFIAARSGDRQAFSISWEPWSASSAEQWKLYAFCDRGAYRPGQTVSWKLTGRRQEDSRYTTPAGQKLDWELVSQTGSVEAKGRLVLNDFGSAWGEAQPLESWPLGLYSLRVHEAGKHEDEHGALIASESLFRLEEYKLPEFRVAVELATHEDGSPRRFRPGDELRATVAADYFFGGGVAEATVVAEVYRRPFWPNWTPKREYPWFYEQTNSSPTWWGGRGERVYQATLKTDSEGRCELVFDAGRDDGQDYEYTIEARVTDSSRREIAGSGKVRVTRQGWFAYLDAGHRLYKPGDSAEFELRLLDANQRPVSASGDLVLLRRTWRETWISPAGRAVEGDELRNLRALSGGFPPPAERGRPAWKLERRGYEDERVGGIEVRTDSEGLATWSRVLAREGYYVLRFAGRDDRGVAVLAETSVYAGTSASRELGNEVTGFALVLDKDTFREGERGAIMLTAPASGRSVLFSVETEELIEHRVVRMDGTVKLLTVDVDERWIPNVFVSASGFHAGELQTDTQRIVVPPTEHFLEVELALEPEVCLPGESAVLEVKLMDHAGQPVEGEVALSLVDESVAAIQEDLALDPRQFFYGQVRAHQVQTRSSTYEKSYMRMVRDAQGELHDARYVWALDVPKEMHEGIDAELGDQLSALGYGGGGGSIRMESRSKARRSSAPSGRAPVAPRAGGSDDFFLGSGVAGNTLSDGDGGAGSGELVVAVRKDFRETALWQPDVRTGADGRARVEFTYPDSLTTWRATARAATRAASFGEARGEGRTRMPLSVRLQAPRFFVVGDECVLSLNLDNRTDEQLVVAPEFSVEGLELLGFLAEGVLRSEAPASVEVPAQGGLRLDWRVRVTQAGQARFHAKVSAGEYGDAIERELPVHAHGIPVLEAKSGRFDGEGVDLTLDLPAARGAGSTEVFVQVTPSLAVTMLDALPYLVDYPYGCTEQTLSRFVPAVVVRRTLEQLGVDPELAMQRAFGGIEPEHAGETQRKTKASLSELDAVTAASLERLYSLQHADGSWSWWSHGEGDPFMTAYAVWSLSLARSAGVEVDVDRLARGASWLGEQLVEVDSAPELRAWMLHAHARWLAQREDTRQREFADKAFAAAMKGRRQLNAYGKALLALAAVDLGRTDDARLLAENLIDGVQRDDAPDASIVQLGHAAGGTQSPRAHWGTDGVGYRWSDGGVEATAFALMALVAVDPAHELVEPAADWLVSNRRGAQWSNTKTTAICVLALERYLSATGQLAREVGFSVAVNGTEIARRELSGDQLIAAPARFAVPGELLRDGQNRVEIRRFKGQGPLFFSAQARFFSREEPIPPRGHELFVRRQYFRLVARPTLLAGFVHERLPLLDGDSLVSGERVEVVLTVESKNHLEYLLFEDLKPAGLEAVQIRSGEALQARELRADEARYRFGEAARTRTGLGRRKSDERPGAGYTGRTRQVHQELRDRKVALFLDQCPQGYWELRYDLRAEVPGTFHALPLLGQAMYVPEVRANGAELRLTVVDRADP